LPFEALATGTTPGPNRGFVAYIRVSFKRLSFPSFARRGGLWGWVCFSVCSVEVVLGVLSLRMSMTPLVVKKK